MRAPGIAHAPDEMAAKDSPAYKSAPLVLVVLLKAETEAGKGRSLAYQMKVARFPA